MQIPDRAPLTPEAIEALPDGARIVLELSGRAGGYAIRTVRIRFGDRRVYRWGRSWWRTLAGRRAWLAEGGE